MSNPVSISVTAARSKNYRCSVPSRTHTVYGESKIIQLEVFVPWRLSLLCPPLRDVYCTQSSIQHCKLRCIQLTPSRSLPHMSLLRHHSCVLTDGIGEVVGGPASSASSDIVFHSEVGASIELSNSRRTARRVRSYQYYCFS